MTELKHTFIDLVSRHNCENHEVYWNEIVDHYSNKDRHYHTLDHLNNLLNQLNNVKSLVSDWDTILFTLYYHDFVYNAKKSDNEEVSAKEAEKRMKVLGIPDPTIEKCKQQILATKTHQINSDQDTNLFTDADLSILGQSWENYENYYKGVRQEYNIYPDLIYKPGRKKVLQHFLSMDRIFKTDYFFDKFEQQARINLVKEISLL